jgi:sigma-E factor negative regulatory protein RseB
MQIAPFALAEPNAQPESPPLGTSSNIDASSGPQSELQPESQVEVQSLPSLFAKMSRVSHSLNYQGSFTYEHQLGASLQSFRVSHWVIDGVEHERLQYLNGPEREIVRHGQQLDCLPPGDQLLQGRLTQIGARLAKLDELYTFQARYLERVAGRLTTVLQVQPRDAYRFGYILSVDQETGMVLKSLMVDASGRILERYQFVELDLNPDIEALQQLPAAKRQRVANSSLSECNLTEIGAPQGWALRWAPPGFVFVGQQKLKNARDMLMYTDGLTTFSVFIEPASNSPLEGIGQRGATVLYMGMLMHEQRLHRVAVVGEIPAAAAEQVALGVRPQTSTAE